MANFYTLLGVAPDADQAAISQAYLQLQERYAEAHVAELDGEMQRVAAERRAELERAYAVLSDPARRRAYDASLRGDSHQDKARVAESRGLSPRERAFALVGGLAALGLVALIWVLTGREPAPQGQAMPEVNRPAPLFSTAALDGGTVNLADYSGDVVVLNFWATWCEPCKRELPALEQAHQTYGPEGLAIIGVNLTDDELAQGGDQAKLDAFLAQYGVSFPIALDLEGEITNAYRVFPLPTSFFIDPQGRIRYVHIGELTLEDVAARFVELRGQTAVSPAQE
jgi:peroxiredoxin